MTCPNCQTTNRAGARFCDACGTSLAARASGGVARKVVTIVFADLIGSTALHERLDAESARRLMDRYYRVLHSAIEAHGGTVVKLLGDGVMAAFGVPRVAEDDALRAVRAALDMQEAFRRLVAEQRALLGSVGLRIALNTGEVVVSEDQTDVVGDPVNVAARLQQEAQDGDVLIGESTRRLVHDAVVLAPFGVLALRGRAESVAAYRVVSLEGPRRDAGLAFVGRNAELRRLRAAYDEAVASRRARLAVVLGSPGLGKSRLLAEFVRRLAGEATVVQASCDAAGGATFAPIAEALRPLLGGSGGTELRRAIDDLIAGDDVERGRVQAGIAAVVADSSASPDEIFFAVRRLLSALAARRPVVLAIDDLQWAEPLLVDLTEHLVQWAAGVPLLVLVAARPELRGLRPSLAVPGPVAREVLTLAGLEAGAATRLAANVIGASELPAAVAGRVLAISEGNPLFVGELVRMLVHDGVLKHDGERWTMGVELADLDMPPTIHALLAARIDRLRAPERTVLERAAVVGRQFSRAAVARLLPEDAAADLDACLDSLRRNELIQADAGTFLGEPALRFHHMLIRDAAYRRLLKETRAELHDGLAAWIASRTADSVEHDELIGWHLEQAHQHLRELGPLDERGRALGERAARHLAAAGRRSLARDDVPLAATLLGRALDRLDDASPARAELVLDWCEALLAAGDVVRGARAVAELGHLAADSTRLRAWQTCFAGQLAALADPQALRATADAVAAASGHLRDVGDMVGEAKAHAVYATALARLGRIGDSEAALDRALAAARQAGDRRRANAVLAGAPMAALWGPSPVTRASGRCLDVVRVLRITQGAPAVEAVALRCQAVLEALRGRDDAARRMIESARRLVEELGLVHQLLETDVFAGHIELLHGDAVAAEERLRPAYEALRSRGLGIDAARAGALLGLALLALGRGDEAEAHSQECERLAGDDLKAAIAWRAVRAGALARRQAHADAIAVARAAVDIAASTDALLDHADARMALATALRACGRDAEAAVELSRAVQLWEAKGATLLAERARSDAPMPARAGEVRASVPADADAGGSPRFANAATSATERFFANWAAREWNAALGMFADGGRIVDRRALVGTDLTGDALVASFRAILDIGFTQWHGTLLATRGDRLALYRTQVALESGETGPAIVDYLGLNEVDAAGWTTRFVIFDPGDVDAAYIELEDRWLAGEGAPWAELFLDDRAFRQASAARDWDAVARLLPDDYTLVNNRRFGGTGGRLTRDEYIAWRRSTDDLHVRADMRIDHVVRISARVGMHVGTSYGTIDEGPFELPFISVFTHDGRYFHSSELFDIDHFDEALARYEALVRATAVAPPAASLTNVATRMVDRFVEAWAARDWERCAGLFAPQFRVFDRRALLQLEYDRAALLESMQPMWRLPASRFRARVLATRGDRLMLTVGGFEGTEEAAGPSEIEFLTVSEVDDEGRRVAMVMFDMTDLDAAYAELDRRYDAGEAVAHPHTALAHAFRHAFAARDWDAFVQVLADDVVVCDHRPLGWETLHGPAAYAAALRSLVDLAPDVRLRIDHVLALSECAALYATSWTGTREGGAFEEPSVIVAEFDGHGRFRRFDQFEAGQLDRARARYAAAVGGARESAVTPGNAATAAMDAVEAAFAAHDWDALRALCVETAHIEDRRHHTRVSGAREWWIGDVRLIAEEAPGASYRRRLVGTAGPHIVVERVLWSGTAGPAQGSFEIEYLWLAEVDDAGRIIAMAAIDLADQAAAVHEARERWMARDPVAAAVMRPVFGMARALAIHDVPGVRAVLADDVVVQDHRPSRLGTIHGGDAYAESLAALWELAPDIRLDAPVGPLVWDAHGCVGITHTTGTFPAGGSFETDLAVLSIVEGGRITRLEYFDGDGVHAALVRFQTLRPQVATKAG